MNLFGGVIPVTGITFLMFCVFGVLFFGYAIGRITIKGVSLGDAGVFVVALIFGALFYTQLEGQLMIKTLVDGKEIAVNFAEKSEDVAGFRVFMPLVCCDVIKSKMFRLSS